MAAAELFLSGNRQFLSATDDELEALTLAVAQETIEAESLAIWFRQRLYSE